MSSSAALGTVLLSGVRLAFWLGSRRFVSRHLLADLRNVIRLDESNVSALDDALESAQTPGLELESSSSASSNGEHSLRSPKPELSRRPSHGQQQQQQQQQQQLMPRLATAIFCAAFSESCLLFSLVLFGDVVSQRARELNWSISLLTLLALIVFIIPLGLCLALVHRSSTSSSTRTTALSARQLVAALVPYGLYLFLFSNITRLVGQSVHLHTGSHKLSLVNALLARVCVPGVALIAALSGGGAVNTAFEARDWRQASSLNGNVSDQVIIDAERSLYRARMERASLERAVLSASARHSDAPPSSGWSSWWSSSSASSREAFEQRAQFDGLERVERQLARDVVRLKRRRELALMRRTLQGRIWLAAGWLLSVYCVWRVFISAVNLIFGYSHTAASAPPESQPDLPPATSRGSDLVTSLLGRLAHALQIEIDVQSWSRMLGLLLVGGIILANLRVVLGSISRVFRATHSGLGASFMLLFLAQLLAVYLLTSLIALPSSPATDSLLDTLPSFNIFSRLFDSVFLIAASSVFVVRWLDTKIRSDQDDVPFG